MKRFLFAYAAALLGFLLVVAAFNLWVDPYRIWRISGGYSQTHPRPRTSQHVALFKERALASMRPVTVILGNSRAEIGLDPGSPAWPANAVPVFNAAIPGSSIETALDTLSRSLTTGRVQNVVIGLEFLDFLVDPREVARPRTAIAGERTPARGDARVALGKFMGDAKLLMSLDTLFDAMITLYKHNDANSADLTLHGFNPFREYALNVTQEGYGALFLQRDTENARNYVHFPRHIFVGTSGSSDAWHAFDEVIGLARRNHLKVHFIIYPYHAHILQMFRESGLMPAFDSWKRHLVEVIGNEGRSDDASCRLWDFSGYHGFATEQVPAAGDKSTTVEWYWESGHFKRQLGDRMLARMFGGGDRAFGVCLTPANVDDRIAALKRDQDRYVAENPRDSNAISQLVRAQMKDNPKP